MTPLNIVNVSDIYHRLSESGYTLGIVDAFVYEIGMENFIIYKFI